MWALLAILAPIVIAVLFSLFSDFKEKHKENTSTELFIRVIIFWVVISIFILLIKT